MVQVVNGVYAVLSYLYTAAVFPVWQNLRIYAFARGAIVQLYELVVCCVWGYAWRGCGWNGEMSCKAISQVRYGTDDIYFYVRQNKIN